MALCLFSLEPNLEMPHGTQNRLHKWHSQWSITLARETQHQGNRSITFTQGNATPGQQLPFRPYLW